MSRKNKVPILFPDAEAAEVAVFVAERTAQERKRLKTNRAAKAAAVEAAKEKFGCSRRTVQYRLAAAAESAAAYATAYPRDTTLPRGTPVFGDYPRWALALLAHQTSKESRAAVWAAFEEHWAYTKNLKAALLSLADVEVLRENGTVKFGPGARLKPKR
jgi:hypothetical protein